MKLITKGALVVGALTMLLGTSAYAAPDRTGKFDAGVHLAGAFSTDSDINSAFYVGGDFAYGINEWAAVGFSAGWQQHGSDDVVIAPGVTLPGPDFNATPIFGELILRVPTAEGTPYTPYFVLGLGTVIWDADDTTTNTGVLVETNIDDAFATKIGGGVDWFIDKNWILNFEGAYVFNRPDVTTTASIAGFSASAIDTVNLDYWTIGGGVKYLFD